MFQVWQLHTPFTFILLCWSGVDTGYDKGSIIIYIDNQNGEPWGDGKRVEWWVRSLPWRDEAICTAVTAQIRTAKMCLMDKKGEW